MPLQPLDSPVEDSTPTRVVLAVLACRRPDGTYAFVPADANGLIPTSGGTGGPGGGEVTVLNWPATQDVAGQVEVGNWPAGFLSAVTNWPSSQAVTGTFWQATQPVSGTFWPATQPVSGAFWQATQPVSIASPVAVTGTFWQATQPVSGSVNATCSGTVAVSGSVAVTGTFFQATQPVSLAVCPLPSGASTEATLSALNGKVTACNTGAVTVAVSALPAGAATEATLAAIGKPSTLCATATGASGAAVTLTIAAAGVGLFHYITHIRIELYAAAARTGSATPIVVTTTNLPGPLAYTFETAQAIGTAIDRVTELSNPMKSSAANTLTQIVCPVATTGIWRVTVHYYAAA